MTFDFGYHFGFRLGGGAPTPPPTPDPDFVIRVKTDNAGTSNNDQFTLPTILVGYDYTIDWGDSTVEDITTNTSQTHTYPESGEYIIRISGTFPRIFFNNGGDKLKLIETVNFGDVGWTNMGASFWGCANNVINANATGDFTGVNSIQDAWRSNNLTFFPYLEFPNVTVIRNAWFDNDLTTFPSIDFPLAINVFGTWRGNKLDSFPLIDLSSAENLQDAWANNNLTSFPAIDLSSGTIFQSAWFSNNLTTFPAIDMPNGTIFQSAWANNNLTSFPLINLSSGTSFSIAWANNDLTSFPAIDMPNGTNFAFAWFNNGVITSFATRNFYAMTNGGSCFLGTTLPTEDYSDILVTQRANNNNNNVTFHGGSSKYNVDGGVARAELTDAVADGGQNWSITDGGAE
jgi:hypothetical protein